jgi:pilus assembly protein FimV
MSTNGSLSLAEIMNQLAVLNGDAANLSVLEDVGANPVAVVDELPAEPSLQLEAEDLKLDLGAADADEDDDHARTVQGLTDMLQDDEWMEAVEKVWGQTPEDRPAEEIVEEVVEEAAPQKEFTIVDEDDDVVDKAYSREMITNDGNDEEIDIADEQNDDGIEEIELDLGNADAQEDDDEEEVGAAVEVEDFEDEAALRAALDDEALEAQDEPAIATAVEEVEIPAALNPSDRSFIDIDQALEDSIREPSVFIPDFSEISDVQFSERSAPIWGPGIDVDNYSTAADSTIASFNELSGLGPAALATTVAQVIPEQTTEIQVETPAFEVPSEIEPAVESLVTSVVEPVVEPEFRAEPGSVETLVIEQPAEVIVTQVVETPAAIVEEVKDVQELKEEIAQDKAEIAKAAPEVSAGIQAAIEDKVEEIAEKQDEIVVLQQEIAAAQTATETPAVIAEKQEELLEAKLDIADKVEEVAELKNLAQEQAAILAEPALVARIQNLCPPHAFRCCRCYFDTGTSS